MSVTVLDIDRLIETYEERCELFDYEVRRLIDLYHERAITPDEVETLVDALLAFVHSEEGR